MLKLTPINRQKDWREIKVRKHSCFLDLGQAPFFLRSGNEISNPKENNKWFFNMAILQKKK